MTTADELNALAARVTPLDGPDREVDAAIQRACGVDDGSYWFIGPSGEHTKDDMAPAYTASLDAAMSLVPASKDWNAGWQEEGVYPNRVVRGTAWVDTGTRVWAATPALALTAAALLARTADQEKQNGRS